MKGANSIKPVSEGKHLLHLQYSSQKQTYGLGDSTGEVENDDSEDEDDELVRQNLLLREKDFTIHYDAQKGYRGTELKMSSFARPHMRAMHASWICFFASFFTQFAMAPLLPVIGESLHLTKTDIWKSNCFMMLGGIPVRFLLGALCDKYGARLTMTTMLALCGVVCGLSGLLVVNVSSLIWTRFIIGALDTFVPCQYWITVMFTREVAGSAMAIASGLGAVGSAVTQVVVGSAIFPLIALFADGDEDFAWRISLIFPGVLSLSIAWFFLAFSDDCPLGNFMEVKRAGLMLERSAVDSFRSGALNINSWLLFLQFAFSCGVDFTMCNGAAVYFHHHFDEPVVQASAIAFLYGISALFARGVGGYLSDMMSEWLSLRGRLLAQLVCMLLQGLLNVWFARIDTIGNSIALMVVFSIFVQMSMGTCFAIVPYVDGPNIGSVAGIVGAGGNVGAAILGKVFMSYDYPGAMEAMGWLTVASAFVTPLIVVKGYKGLLFGQEDEDGTDVKIQHSPLIVPRKFQHSPHLVAYRQKQRRKT